MTVVVNPAQADVNTCNLLDAPTRGRDWGGGTHVVVPADYAAQIAAGRDVPGCTYAALTQRDTGVLDKAGDPVLETVLVVSDAVQAKLMSPAEIAKLDAKQQTDAQALAAKLSIVTSAVPLDARLASAAK